MNVVSLMASTFLALSWYGMYGTTLCDAQPVEESACLHHLHAGRPHNVRHGGVLASYTVSRVPPKTQMGIFATGDIKLERNNCFQARGNASSYFPTSPVIAWSSEVESHCIGCDAPGQTLGTYSSCGRGGL